MNLDDFIDTLTLSNIFDVVHHASGDVTSSNMLPALLTLDAIGNPFGTNGFSVEVVHTYPVLPGDENLLDGALLDDARTAGKDNHDGINGTGLSQAFLLTFPGQIRVINPCLSVTKTCLNGVGAAGTVSFSGSISNCGNTVLTNVIVSNFVNNAFVYVLGPITLGVNGAERLVTFTGNYTPNDPCHAATDTLVAWGTDELGLTITNSASATCPIRQTLAITCPSNITVQCFANVPPPNVGLVTVISSAGAANVIVTHNSDVITTNGCGLSIARTYDAVDCWNNTASCTQTITVRDTIAPTLIGVPSNQTYPCLSQVPVAAIVTAIDNCTPNVSVTRTSTTNGFRPTLIVNCWRAVDACGNATTACQTNTVVDSGAAIGDFVWEDRDHNGRQGAGEPGIANVVVQLLDCASNLVFTTQTDPNGFYLFSGLVPGNYEVKFFPPAGYFFTTANAGSDDTVDSDADPVSGLSICVAVVCGETNRTVDAGLFRPPSIGDFVWEDRNRNGLQDAGEPGISNVLVRLMDCAGNQITVTNTDINGLYLFTGLVPGSYQVQFVMPGGFTFTLPNVGANDAIDSDVNPADGKSPCTVLSSGETNRTVDAGGFRSAVVGDFVWDDRNHNGLQDAGEPGISNVLVKLLNCTGTEVTRTNTDADGFYLFTGLVPGSYQVQFTAPAGYFFTLRDAGSDDSIDSDANSADGKSPCITLASGESNRTVDAGLFRPAAIGDFVWEDRNHNGLQDAGEPGIANVQVRLLDCSGTEITRTNTGANGLYLFSGLFPGAYMVQFIAPSNYTFTMLDAGADDTIDSDANPLDGKSLCTTLASGVTNRTVDAGLFRSTSIGDFVWEDRNHNGLQDAGEPGISNALVRLLNCGGVEIARTNTDANGLYLFSGLVPGSYVVQFVAPGGYSFTLSNVGADRAIDSDANPSDGTTACTTLASGEVNRTIDAGLFRPAAIGDFVWEDRNHNGLQEAGEPGIPNVLVRLLDCTGAEITTTTTDGNGFYLFSGLVPGGYTIQFVAPGGYSFTLANVGANDNIDSDANVSTGKSPCVTLASGETNRSIDAGLFRTAAIGDFVWNDLNTNGVQDAGEPGIPNAVVRLLDCSNALIATTNTDANGLYLFSGLAPGSYIVQFVLPVNYQFTLLHQGGDSALDSDADQVSGKSQCVTLSSGDLNLTIDAGISKPDVCIPSCAIGAWSDPAYRPSNKPPGRNQAFWARGISTNLVFYPQPANWVENNDGTAQLSGTLRSLTNLGSGFVMSMTLNGRQLTPPPGSPIEEMDPRAYVRNGGPIDSSTWYYYTNFTGTLTGFGFWEGAVIAFKRDPFGPFEIGVGANGKNTHFGATGWWSWTVVHQPASGNLGPMPLYGNINIDLVCCSPSTIGDFVWQDLNQNGLQDAGEPGIANAVVRLLDCTNKVVLTNTTTDANGLYQFGSLMPGSYIVQFVPPSGFSFTLPLQGNDIARDSDADLTSGSSQCINLSSNEINLTVDAGLISNCPPSCVIGAWSDPTYRPSDKPAGRNQAIWMRGVSTNLVFTPDPGRWVENSDGTAQMSGTVHSLTNTSSGFEVVLNLTGRRTTAPSGSPMLELDPRAYVDKGGPLDPAKWYYYTSFTGTLTGFGYWQGARLTVTPNGAAFQVGVGANGKNQDFGASAWFDWKVVQQPAHQLPSTGMGDFNVDLFCCQLPRVVALQRTSATGRKMTIQGMIGPSYTIEGSSDMITWKTITTLPNSNGILQFNDTTPGTCCFYRVKLQPY